MARLTQDMKDIAAKAGPFVFATASKEGKPNGVPIGLVKIVSDDEVMLVDVGMNKTRQNIAENPRVAATCWSAGDHYGFQFKGRARVETSGRLFEEAKRLVEAKKMPPHLGAKAAVVVKVEEVYYVGADKDCGQNLVK